MKKVAIPFEGNLLTFELSNDNVAEGLNPHRTPPIHDVEAAATESLASPLDQKPLAEAKQAFFHAEGVEGALKEAFKRQDPHARVSILSVRPGYASHQCMLT